MKTRSALITVLVVLAASVVTQSVQGQSDKPDFSGTWVRDNTKNFGLQGALASAELTMSITHKDPELRIARSIKLSEQPMSQEVTYYTDHRGETNPSAFSSGEV